MADVESSYGKGIWLGSANDIYPSLVIHLVFLSVEYHQRVMEEETRMEEQKFSLLKEPEKLRMEMFEPGVVRVDWDYAPGHSFFRMDAAQARLEYVKAHPEQYFGDGGQQRDIERSEQIIAFLEANQE
jgi:hypothetical protein